LQKSDFDLEAFYVVIVMKPNNHDCRVLDSIISHGNSSAYKKTVTISVKETISSKHEQLVCVCVVGLGEIFYCG
jgi:hypothetical protein